MCDQIAAQNLALNIALKATSTPGFSALIFATTTFSLKSNTNANAMNNQFYRNFGLNLAYLFGFGSKVSGLGFGFFDVRFGNG